MTSKWANPRVAAVTGANKGIGHAIVRNLALHYPYSPLNDGSRLIIYLTARDTRRGIDALNLIQRDKALRRNEAVKKHRRGFLHVRYRPLNVSSDGSIAAFAKHLNTEHPEGIDLLVNNAGVALDGFDAKVVEQTLACNYHGTLKMTQELMPLISKKKGRIINISSMVGKLGKYPEPLAERFREAKEVDDVTKLMNEFQDAVAAGNHTERGWPSSAYAVSKSGVTAISKVLGQKSLAEYGVLLNSCCPGYVNTDMTKGRGRKTPDQGTSTPVHLALNDIGQTSGEFWENKDVSTW